MDNAVNLFNESGIEILIRDDGYINATALCQQAKKEFKHWKELQATFEFLKTLSSEVGITTSGLTQTRKGGLPQEQGTWIHELVAINLAQWLSPKYAVLVTKVMQKFHRGELGNDQTLKPLPEKVKEIQATESVFKSFHEIGALAGFEGNQLTLFCNKGARNTTGIDALALGESIELKAKVQETLLTPTEVGQRIGISSRKINPLLEERGLQRGYRDHKNRQRWELTDFGKENYAQYEDVGKPHSDGSPIRQIRWYESVVDFLLEEPPANVIPMDLPSTVNQGSTQV